MHRSILTGFFAFSLTLGSWTIAFAGDPALPNSDQAAGTAAQSAGTQAGLTPDVSSSAGDAGAAVPIAATAADSAGRPADMTLGAAFVPVIAPLRSTLIPANADRKPLSRLRRFAGSIASRTSAIASSLTRSAMRFIGVPYVFGGTRATGFDCSGYVQHVFALHGLHLPRTADAQFDVARRIRSPLTAGDLVFFHTYAPGVSHVGIYLGHSRFIHASSSRGVAVSSLHDRYWAPRYVGAKRVVGS